ncbi:hypothetical protein [Bacillus sp. JJ1562]|uniref:hypothetical protein n=1 Tax=Bacillus sp. JJ1562 TaxID=3122960 RepID=UPI003001E4F1
MDFVEVAVLVFIWGIFGFNLIKKYKKSKKDNRNRLLEQLKDFDFWVDGLRNIGILLFITGMIAGISVVKHIGAYLLVAGWLLGSIVLLEKNKKRGAAGIVVAILFGLVYYLIWF